MSLTWWLVLLGTVGVCYAFWHLDRAYRTWLAVMRAGRATELMRWVASGDLLTMIGLVVLAILLVVVDAAPLLNPRFAAFVQQSAYLGFHALFVIGIALVRLYALRQPLGQPEGEGPAAQAYGQRGDGR